MIEIAVIGVIAVFFAVNAYVYSKYIDVDYD